MKASVVAGFRNISYICTKVFYCILFTVCTWIWCVMYFIFAFWIITLSLEKAALLYSLEYHIAANIHHNYLLCNFFVYYSTFFMTMLFSLHVTVIYTHIFSLHSLKNEHVNQREASALWQVRIVYSNRRRGWEQSMANVWIPNGAFMKTAETLSSILKKHYTHSERKVEMLTFMLCRVRTSMCACTHIRKQTETQTKHCT